jgi:hypothetical protein
VSLPLWLEPAAVVDKLADCCWISGMLSKVRCSTVSVMVGRAWVGGW